MMIKFSEVLKNLIQEKGITQTTLAKIIDVKPNTVATYCAGKSYPEFRTLIKIAEFFDVSLDYLVTGERVENQTAREALGLSESAVENLGGRGIEINFSCDVLLSDKDFYSEFSRAMNALAFYKSFFEAKGKEFEDVKKRFNLSNLDLLKNAVLEPAQIMRDYFIKFFAKIPVWN
ncbi:MAG: helix-turn-helix transcriptional regulator [Synergistaceae bacterium]|nr:helix-turn-helix transcriptional regulator [Synergistaceae bacterium]